MTTVIVVSAVYPPEPVVSAQMSRDLAEELVARPGVDVLVLCPFPTRPIGAYHSDHQVRHLPESRLEGRVTVVRLPSYTHPESQLFGRVRESYSFGSQVRRFLKNESVSIDVLYANTWPLGSQGPISRYCVRNHIPLIWHIQDLYPETLLSRLPARLGSILDPPLVAFDRKLAHRAAHTVVISEPMRRTYAESRRLRLERVTRITNWVDESRYVEVGFTRQEACSRYGIASEPFTFLYFGNVGALAGVEYLIETFASTSGSDMQLVIAGDGARKSACVELARKLGDERIHFVSDPDAQSVPAIQSLGHVSLLPLKVGSGESSVPSKLMAYMLSGRPVLATVDRDSDTARTIREADCGWVGPPEDPTWLRDAMLRVGQLPTTELAAVGQRGREYGLREFSKSRGVNRLADLVLSCGQEATGN